MKQLSVLIALATMSLSTMAQTEVNSQIEKVTVYPSTALVEKCVTVSLSKGENQFVIHGNAQTIETSDIHFASSPDWFICSMHSQRGTLPALEVLAREMPGAAYTQYQSLRAQADEVALKISNANILVSTLVQQAQALNNMKAVRNTAAFDTIVNLKAQFEYQRKESQAINSQLAKANKELEELGVRQRQLEKEIQGLVRKYTGGKEVLNQQNDIYVSVYSNKAIPNAKIAYSYRTTNVSCGYAYDVMLDENKRQAVFSLKASVHQATGEHWNNCPMAFSTTESGFAGFDSELPVYYLNYYTPAPQHRAAMAKGLARNMVTSSYAVMEEASYDAATLNTLSLRNNLTLSREYVLQARQTVPSNDNIQTLLLQNDTTSVLFARFATPKNEEKVHFTALLPHWESLGLLEVGCNVYLNNRFVSTSEVVTAGSGDTLRFSVGQDPNVLVKRKYTMSTPDKGLLSKEVSRTVTVTLSIKNTKHEPVELRLKDQVPVSANAEIKVSDLNLGGGVLDEKTGIIRWIQPLKALEQHDIVFSYTVKYPKEREGEIVLR